MPVPVPALGSAGVAAGLAALLVVACSTAPPAPPVLHDGQLRVPPGYRSWPKYLSAVQRPDLEEVREIYLSPGARTSEAGFADGTVLVMEIYAARRDAAGTVLTAADGAMTAATLERVLVMGKNAGWGEGQPEPLRNGRWVYATYLPDGRKAPEEPMTCRACHRQRAAARDFVPRYDEFLASRAARR